MKFKLIFTTLVFTTLASFSMPVYSNSLCESAQRNAAQAQSNFVSARTARQQACHANPNGDLCSIASLIEFQSGERAAQAAAVAVATCRIFYSIK